MAMDLSQIQGQLEQKYSDYLRQKRELSGVRGVAQERLASSFQPTQSGTYANPADIFRAFQTFQTAVPSEAESLGTEADILKQIATLAQAQQPEAVSLADQIKAYEAGGTIEGGSFVPKAGVAGILTDKQKSDLLTQRKTLLEQGLDTTTIDEQLRAAGILKDTGEKEDIIALIDEILSRDLKPITGNIRLGGIPLLNRPDVNTTKAKIDQLMGYLTLENRQKLRGQGTITDREQKTLEQASTTLGTKAQRTEDYIKELQKLRTGLSAKVGGKAEEKPTAGPSPAIKDTLGIL